eukprot:363132-Chlamydomonas_euryale.AAC.12
MKPQSVPKRTRRDGRLVAPSCRGPHSLAARRLPGQRTHEDTPMSHRRKPRVCGGHVHATPRLNRVAQVQPLWRAVDSPGITDRH